MKAGLVIVLLLLSAAFPLSKAQAESVDEASRRSFDGHELPSATDVGATKILHKELQDISLDVLPRGHEYDVGRPSESSRGHAGVGFQWRPSELLSKQLYFEDVSLERYGYRSHLQPARSALKFFGTIPLLPCKFVANPPWTCTHRLGYCRPGDCAKPIRERVLR